ncbi:SDR family oxidoreductase [Parashewanella curva]|uniref:SDR family oxidoreductase n=1 Tax=Parashewanella curva TaxID=2338552 RepID=A0A3L8PZX9_9GAMM|nr:SDR family oxidoreductase [Parashewanella curva]RLV60921.1 SDR family oxidoreductase [Parashewanella curva]
MKKVVVITGGGRGIGAATAKVLVSEGYFVCINFKSNQQKAEQLVDEIKQAGGMAVAFKADVSNTQGVKSLFEFAVSELGVVTHLVNNVGILETQSPLTELTESRINRILTNNITSYFLCSKFALEHMPNGGAIVNIGSVAARTGAPNEYLDYAASKGAIDSLTIGLAKELAPRNIRVNCVRPAIIDTEIHADGGEVNRVKRLADAIPLKRYGKAEEVAHTISWLLSEKASFITGDIIDVSGGL